MSDSFADKYRRDDSYKSDKKNKKRNKKKEFKLKLKEENGQYD